MIKKVLYINGDRLSHHLTGLPRRGMVNMSVYTRANIRNGINHKQTSCGMAHIGSLEYNAL